MRIGRLREREKTRMSPLATVKNALSSRTPTIHMLTANGAECDYAWPSDSGKNDREASYFEKATALSATLSTAIMQRTLISLQVELKLKSAHGGKALSMR